MVEENIAIASIHHDAATLVPISYQSLKLVAVTSSTEQNLLNGQLCVSESDCIPLLWVIFFVSIIIMWTTWVMK
jgi:hypothetical protein